MCSTSSWKGRDGEDSALALQGAGTWMLGEVGNGISSTKLPKGPGKRRGGNSEKEFPKENSYSKAGMHLCQQNDANSTFRERSWKDPLEFQAPHTHTGRGLGQSCHTRPLLSIPGLALTAGSGGAVGSSGCAPPTPQLPELRNYALQELTAQRCWKSTSGSFLGGWHPTSLEKTNLTPTKGEMQRGPCPALHTAGQGSPGALSLPGRDSSVTLRDPGSLWSV